MPPVDSPSPAATSAGEAARSPDERDRATNRKSPEHAIKTVMQESDTLTSQHAEECSIRCLEEPFFSNSATRATLSDHAISAYTTSFVYSSELDDQENRPQAQAEREEETHVAADNLAVQQAKKANLAALLGGHAQRQQQHARAH
jgi:hypothetical protein